MKNSGIWNAFSGEDTYIELHRYSGYDIKNWVNENINWIEDLNHEFVVFLQKQNLLQYLTW